jgi:hypothetical protein
MSQLMLSTHATALTQTNEHTEHPPQSRSCKEIQYAEKKDMPQETYQATVTEEFPTQPPEVGWVMVIAEAKRGREATIRAAKECMAKANRTIRDYRQSSWQYFSGTVKSGRLTGQGVDGGGWAFLRGDSWEFFLDSTPP